MLLAKVLVAKSAAICDFAAGDFAESRTPAQYEDYSEIVNLFQGPKCLYIMIMFKISDKPEAPLPRWCARDVFQRSFSCRSVRPHVGCLSSESLLHCNWVRTILCWNRPPGSTCRPDGLLTATAIMSIRLIYWNWYLNCKKIVYVSANSTSSDNGQQPLIQPKTCYSFSGMLSFNIHKTNTNSRSMNNKHQS